MEDRIVSQEKSGQEERIVDIADYERKEDARLEYLEICRIRKDYLVSKGRVDERER